ncbi:MAG: ester cyclase [Porticoccaceae bacterium]|jgi:predicted ester cyclase
MDRMQHHFDSAPSKVKSHKSPMAGFDDEFTDIVDYILRITYRIWEGKQIGLCYDYYSDDCPVYTMSGITIGAEEVTQNTLSTLASFPDRTLQAENVVWGGNDIDGYHTSHLIKTSMTNLGGSDMGPATNMETTFLVIAHCIVKDNKIIEEWLVRDNYALAEELGFDVHQVAREKAAIPIQQRLKDWNQSELNRVQKSVTHERQPFLGCSSNDSEGFIKALLQNIWNARLLGDVFQSYSDDALLHCSRNQTLKGREEIAAFYAQIIGTVTQLKFSHDYCCSIPNDNGGKDVAVRWTITGNHGGAGLYGEPTGTPLLILGESQFRIIDGLIAEEWTIFDELSILVQIYRARLSIAE